MNIYLSIGAQCTTTALFRKLQVKNESFPFDWMFSTPQFVYTILKLLLIDKLEIEDIVDNHFFACDTRAQLQSVEHHILKKDGPVLVNSKYNVCFPHDTISDRDKYIRRIARLKHVLLDTNNFLYFMYVSVSSPTRGNYTINGVKPIQQLYTYIENIHTMLKDIRTNYTIIVFDTNKPSNILPSDTAYLKYYDIQKKDCWSQLLPELLHKCNALLDANVIHI